ncbi:MAG TPA: methyltransferase domain-containing protein, partial [Thermoanaerobaculia bacterium]|nr:methyltransferase domain-containing protein [Thermoanaerobaculia bacterium]
MNPRRAHFDALAGRWEAIRSSEQAAEAVERGLALVEPLSGARVADVGCGTGAVLGPLLRRLGPGGGVIAIDISPRMLGIARQRHPDPRIEWRE